MLLRKLLIDSTWTLCPKQFSCTHRSLQSNGCDHCVFVGCMSGTNLGWSITLVGECKLWQATLGNRLLWEVSGDWFCKLIFGKRSMIIESFALQWSHDCLIAFRPFFCRRWGHSNDQLVLSHECTHVVSLFIDIVLDHMESVSIF